MLDAVTGKEAAGVSSAGIDVGAALDCGQATGGPALREPVSHGARRCSGRWVSWPAAGIRLSGARK